MATFIALFNFTEQGLRSFRDTAHRAEAFTRAAHQGGIEVKAIYWTFGRYDGVIVLEAPDDESAAAAILTLASAGNVRTQLLRAFTREEVQRILAKSW